MFLGRGMALQGRQGHPRQDERICCPNVLLEAGVRLTHHNGGWEKTDRCSQENSLSFLEAVAMTLVVGGHWCRGQAAGILVDVDQEL